MPMCINIHNRRCISHTSVKKKGTIIRPSIDLETESISVDKYTKHNIIRKGNNNTSNIYKHVISSDEYKESWTRSVGREYIRDKVRNNCVVFALFGPPRGRFVTTIHEYTILFTRRLELNACEELKRGPRGGGQRRCNAMQLALRGERTHGWFEAYCTADAPVQDEIVLSRSSISL